MKTIYALISLNQDTIETQLTTRFATKVEQRRESACRAIDSIEFLNDKRAPLPRRRDEIATLRSYDDGASKTTAKRNGGVTAI